MTPKDIEQLLSRAASVGFLGGERVYTRRDLLAATRADCGSDETIKPDKSVADAIHRHEASWGVFQDGDAVRDRDGRIWQMQDGKLVNCARRTPDPNGAHAL